MQDNSEAAAPSLRGAPSGISDGTSGNASGGTSGHASGGTSGNASGGASGGTSGNASGGTSGSASGGTSGNASGGTSGNAPSGISGGTSGNASGGTSGNASGGISGGTPGGTPGNTEPSDSPDPAQASTPPDDAVSPLSGVIAAFSAYILWGILPIFWKALDSVDSLEVLCHRIVWSFLFLLPFMFFKGRLGSLAIFLRRPRNFFGLMLSGFLLTANWYLYIWAIAQGMIVETSLGYYINPLVNILFGVAIFREKTGPLVKLAIAIAVLGVVYQVIALGTLPLVPLGLAFSFGIYALLRKCLLVQAIPGLFVETLVVLPLALFWLLSQANEGNSVFFRGDLVLDALLIGAGFITTVPLILFAYGARRIRMTTLGLLQYINPTCQFVLGVFVYGEIFTMDSFITFTCIWVALALYTWESLRKHSW